MREAKTIATAAIYSGFPDVVEETINLNFLVTCEALIKSPVFDQIHAMTDITNGGLRGDIFEMTETARWPDGGTGGRDTIPCQSPGKGDA